MPPPTRHVCACRFPRGYAGAENGRGGLRVRHRRGHGILSFAGTLRAGCHAQFLRAQFLRAQFLRAQFPHARVPMPAGGAARESREPFRCDRVDWADRVRSGLRCGWGGCGCLCLSGFQQGRPRREAEARSVVIWLLTKASVAAEGWRRVRDGSNGAGGLRAVPRARRGRRRGRRFSDGRDPVRGRACRCPGLWRRLCCGGSSGERCRCGGRASGRVDCRRVIAAGNEDHSAPRGWAGSFGLARWSGRRWLGRRLILACWFGPRNAGVTGRRRGR